MTLYAYTNETFLTGPRTLVSHDQVMITGTGAVFCNSNVVFSALAATRLDFVVQGYVGTFDAVVTLGVSGANSSATFNVGSTGTIAGYTGLALVNTSAMVGNAGLITGRKFGVSLNDDLDQTSKIVNSGTIHGAETGIFLSSFAASDNTILNSGTISAGPYSVSGAAIDTDPTGASTDTVVNSGLISGSVRLGLGNDRLDNDGGRIQGAVDMGAGIDLVVNSGRISGAVLLGSDNDVYETAGAGLAEGTISGGTGNDRFIIGLAQETYAGDGGSDYLDFRKSGAVTVALDRSVEGTGAAEGDSYSGIEHVFGSRNGDDMLIGSSVANRLFGIGGNDILNGLGGQDSLDGGQGIDTLTGGLGNDTFVFAKPGQAGDVITDFSSTGAGNNDRLAISADGFGGGLALGTLAGAYFRARPDNEAQDGNDRVIFNTASRTVWFDADGSGAGEAVLVATLQVTADFTAADVFVIA